MYLKVKLDIDINFEEANFIKETFVKDYDIREISLIQERNITETYVEDTSDIKFEGVDHIVTNSLISVESDHFDKKTLLEIYKNL